MTEIYNTLDLYGYEPCSRGNSAVSIVTRLRAGLPGFSDGSFSLRHRVQTDSEVYPVSSSLGTRGSFAGGERPEREADHSPPSSA
jgi:hypothetical protein